MRLKFKGGIHRVGNVEVHAVAKVMELDSGLVAGRDKYEELKDGTLNTAFSHLSLVAIEKQLAIIVPCMNEEHSVLEGVLHGIPHHCLIILISNSNTDNFSAECAMLTELCTATRRHGIAVHQQDPGLASAFADAGMPHITHAKADTKWQDSDGRIRIRNGKGEAMMIGTAFAKLAGKAFVGFIDADNFVPGAVHEYCTIFAAGLHHALQNQTPTSLPHDQVLAMIRLKWRSKPKIVDGELVSQESGRCSRVVNQWMNRLLASVTGNDIDADFIKSANAGEHAMSIDLALQLQFATGYAVEPFQLINVWERSKVFPPTPPGTSPRPGTDNQTSGEKLMEQPVRILQIETLSPHIHDFGKGEEHILKMQTQGLSTIYHSKLIPQALKRQLGEFISMELTAIVGETGGPQQAYMYPPMQRMDFEVLKQVVAGYAETMCVLGACE